MIHNAGPALYFCMNDVLDALSRRSDGDADPLVRIYMDPISSYVHEEDIFLIDRSEKLLIFADAANGTNLYSLTKDIPLYHINIELALDQALKDSEQDAKLASYLETAFGSRDTVKSLQKIVVGQELAIADTLQYPGLGYIYPEQLCQIYIQFLQQVQNDEAYIAEYGFMKAVLRNYPERFIGSYDGFVSPAEGRTKASWLFEMGYRQDHSHDAQKRMEQYMLEGQSKAQDENLNSPDEYMKAWLNADEYQLRRSRTIDLALKNISIKDSPAWLREDVFKIIEKESMKQHYAKCIMEQDPSSATLEARDNMRLAIENNAKGLADPDIEQFMRETLSAGKPKADATSKFIALAEQRLVESQDI